MKKYSIWVKCLAFFLAVVTLLAVAVGALGVLVAESMHMYTQDDYRTWQNNRYYDMAQEIANQVMRDYGAELSVCPQWLLQDAGYLYAIENVESWFELAENDWYYTIEDSHGNVVRNTNNKTLEEPITFVFENLEANYPQIIARKAIPEAETTIPVQYDGEDAYNMDPTTATEADVYYEYSEVHWDPYNDEEVIVDYVSQYGYKVTVGISKSYTSYYKNNGLSEAAMQEIFKLRYALIIEIAVSLLLFVAVFVLLMCISGRDSKTGEVNPKALNRLPLDLYLAAAVVITIVGCACACELLYMLFDNSGYNVLMLVLMCGCGVIVATTDVGFFMAVAAQFKLPGNYWWQHSICGRIWKAVWKGCRFVFSGISKLLGMLPVIWEWIAVGGVLGIVLLIICSDAHWYTIFPLTVWCLAFAAVVIYGGYCFGTIRKGIKRMNEGNLNEKINTQWMYGSFKTIAEELNALADVVIVAAEKQLKSERMKTELITNVSHDIKTPLTSVINYVDLLQQPHTEEEGQQYLEVLSRQSLRLKKLVEDLMDMSKASSGNIVVNVTSVDAVETVNQALGEFSDKLEAAELTIVFRPQMPQLHMLADGKLTWRVLSNLLSNVVKYALPGTRVYVDLIQLEKQVFLSVKNISREELNISADELTERFVRGDASRNTEGSGLGLNIAESLMRLQRGNMEVTVDGDLFKVTLTFPAE